MKAGANTLLPNLEVQVTCLKGRLRSKVLVRYVYPTRLLYVRNVSKGTLSMPLLL